MDRLLGGKFWAWVVGAYLGAVTFLETYLTSALAFALQKLNAISVIEPFVPDAPDLAAFAPWLFGAVIAAFFYKPVWRFFWRCWGLGPWLCDKVYPDLNGVWDVEMHSNWPVIEAMRNAARDKKAPAFDAAGPRLPLKQVENLVATIDQGWLGLEMVIDPAKPDSRIKRSATIAFDLIRKTGSAPHKLAYVFDQVTRDENREPGDEAGFLGAAMLEVSKDANTLTGHYFTMRNWLAGENTAGTIVLRRRT